mmetsp:Transcript_70204/g.182102  ORF Transcript_70204/g.182102 Transcript_70204/m.182102 type:complete len:335 (-) Transcript_70204:895-1899(-)
MRQMAWHSPRLWSGPWVELMILTVCPLATPKSWRAEGQEALEHLGPKIALQAPSAPSFLAHCAAMLRRLLQTTPLGPQQQRGPSGLPTALVLLQLQQQQPRLRALPLRHLPRTRHPRPQRRRPPMRRCHRSPTLRLQGPQCSPKHPAEGFRLQPLQPPGRLRLPREGCPAAPPLSLPCRVFFRPHVPRRLRPPPLPQHPPRPQATMGGFRCPRPQPLPPPPPQRLPRPGHVHLALGWQGLARPGSVLGLVRPAPPKEATPHPPPPLPPLPLPPTETPPCTPRRWPHPPPLPLRGPHFLLHHLLLLLLCAKPSQRQRHAGRHWRVRSFAYPMSSS